MIYIGIDCGRHTGLAIWDSVQMEFLSVETLPIHEALVKVGMTAQIHKDEGVLVIFEDARLRKWLPMETSRSDYRGKLMGAGSVKRDAVIWEDMLKDLHIPYEAVAPARGMTKWSEETFKGVTGWSHRTSNHARDAALLVFGR